MGLIISGQHIAFEDYEELRNLESVHPYLIDIRLFLEQWFDNTADDIEITTSGSTGNPKQVLLSKHGMKASASNTAKFFQFKKGDRVLLCLPAKFIAGKMMIVRSILSQLSLILVKPSSNPLQNLEVNLDFTPMTVQQFVKSDRDNLNKIKTILLGGGPATDQVRMKLKKLSSIVYHGFGMTETYTHVALGKVNQDENIIYHSLPGILIRTDVHNRLILSSNYFETLITNDLVEVVNEASFKWLGRYDNVINSGGIKLHPELLENKISSLIEVPFIFAGEPDSILGERLVLILEKEGSPNDSVILERVKPLLQKYEQPKKLYLLPNFVRTKNGKIQRQKTLSKLSQNL